MRQYTKIEDAVLAGQTKGKGGVIIHLYIKIVHVKGIKMVVLLNEHTVSKSNCLDVSLRFSVRMKKNKKSKNSFEIDN